ncbi:hypothetical protein [Halobacillus andaensis]|uniref:hypothetical protein n=1 Tax=Halobacillus andaensis TaxID=1176239 RepID=UPI003D70F18F
MHFQLQFAGLALIFTSFILWLSAVETGYVIPDLLAATGTILVAGARVRNRSESHFLCKIGLHKNKQAGWDEEWQSAAIYQCERCGRTKKVIKGV